MSRVLTDLIRIFDWPQCRPSRAKERLIILPCLFAQHIAQAEILSPTYLLTYKVPPQHGISSLNFPSSQQLSQTHSLHLSPFPIPLHLLPTHSLSTHLSDFSVTSCRFFSLQTQNQSRFSLREDLAPSYLATEGAEATGTSLISTFYEIALCGSLTQELTKAASRKASLERKKFYLHLIVAAQEVAHSKSCGVARREQ